MNKKKEEKKESGRVRGILLRNELEYIRKREGDKGVQRIENDLRKEGLLDHPLREVRKREWYPVEWQVELLLKTKELWSWTDRDISEIGYNAFQLPFWSRLFLYFTNTDHALKNGERYWRKYYKIGDLSYSGFDPEEGVVNFQVKNFRVHPVLCPGMAGMLRSMIELITGSRKIEIKETQCPFRDDDHHQFQIKWS